MNYSGYKISEIKTNTCVVGTGAAGYNCACRLKQYGVEDVLLISENRLSGTSRNTGSDKQTYYKLTLSGDTPDSIFEMANTLFEGEAVDGDIALCEAALSVPSFLRLVELGLPFPTNRYGEYIGYKTDHDPRNRATSIGPYTSKQMTEALEKDAEAKDVTLIDKLQVIKVISDTKKAYGLLCLDISDNDNNKFVLIEAENIVFATGGPAGMYANSVYPASQRGSSGLAFEAGVKGKNLTEWQFGMASIKPRWNVSGTYMQVLPRFVSTDKDGNDAKEFLNDFFSDKGDMLTKIFLKGYQWPFDVRKVESGSSIIDILVYLEQCKGRRVFLDFMNDPLDGDFEFTELDREAYEYLEKGRALVKKPIERLKIMNQPAIDFYNDKGVDLEKELLEISLCAQHNNGGLDIDCWWQTNVKSFFAVGEAAASHGVYRPGGSALNASQCGSTRAAQYIANVSSVETHDHNVFLTLAKDAAREMIDLADGIKTEKGNVLDIMAKVMNDMSECGGAIRSNERILKLLDSIDNLLKNFATLVTYDESVQLRWVYRLRDILIAQKCYLSAMVNYNEESGMSRGSSLYTNLRGIHPHDKLPEAFTYLIDDGSRKDLIQEILYKDNNVSFAWRKVRPIPKNDDFFENVWREFRKNKNVF
ncbi:MAG: FAD-binding protein [Anaerolineaceae bacterium]|nr:FAD-binding protein [Anaerolineaceae bacterium]